MSNLFSNRRAPGNSRLVRGTCHIGLRCMYSHTYSQIISLYSQIILRMSWSKFITCNNGTKFRSTAVLSGWVRLLYLTKEALNDGILAGISKLRPHVPLTNRWKCRQTLQLDVVIHLALEFAIRRHLTVEISASAHLHPEFREFREL